jgi:hypothetical protein
MTVLTPHRHTYTEDGHPYPTEQERDGAGSSWRDLRPLWDRDDPDPILGEQAELRDHLEEEMKRIEKQLPIPF